MSGNFLSTAQFAALKLGSPISVYTDGPGCTDDMFPTCEIIRYKFPASELTAGPTLPLTWYDGHHKHSYYLIQHSDIMGLSPDERAQVLSQSFSVDWDLWVKPVARYRELLDKRGLELKQLDLRKIQADFSSEELTDLQVHFALAWMGFTARRPTVADDTDLAAVMAGRISVTPLHIDLTHMPTVHALKSVLGGAPPKLRTKA